MIVGCETFMSTDSDVLRFKTRNQKVQRVDDMSTNK